MILPQKKKKGKKPSEISKQSSSLVKPVPCIIILLFFINIRAFSNLKNKLSPLHAEGWLTSLHLVLISEMI